MSAHTVHGSRQRVIDEGRHFGRAGLARYTDGETFLGLSQVVSIVSARPCCIDREINVVSAVVVVVVGVEWCVCQSVSLEVTAPRMTTDVGFSFRVRFNFCQVRRGRAGGRGGYCSALRMRIWGLAKRLSQRPYTSVYCMHTEYTIDHTPVIHTTQSNTATDWCWTRIQYNIETKKQHSTLL